MKELGKAHLKYLIVGQYPNTALLIGGGSNATPEVSSQANKNFIDLRLKSTATSGTTRGAYLKTYLSSGAGGETIRAFTQIENDTPADTCNGAHVSLGFGTSVGNITGLATAQRNTLHIPGRAINGTIAAVQAEIYGDAASGAIGGTASFLRCALDGHADLKGSFDDNGFLLDIEGLTAGDAHVFKTGITAANLNAGCTCALRVKIGGTTYYIPVSTVNA